MRVREITEDDFDEMAECGSKMLRYGGKFMDKLDQLRHRSRGSHMNERNDDEMDYREMSRSGERMDNHGRGGHRGGYREGFREGFRNEEDDDDRYIARRRW